MTYVMIPLGDATDRQVLAHIARQLETLIRHTHALEDRMSDLDDAVTALTGQVQANTDFVASLTPQLVAAQAAVDAAQAALADETLAADAARAQAQESLTDATENITLIQQATANLQATDTPAPPAG